MGKTWVSSIQNRSDPVLSCPTQQLGGSVFLSLSLAFPVTAYLVDGAHFLAVPQTAHKALSRRLLAAKGPGGGGGAEELLS